MKKRWLVLAVAVWMMFPFVVMKASSEEPPAPASDKGLEEVKPPEVPAPTPGLLMDLLGKAGLAKPFDKAGINLYGYVQGGYLYDISSSSPSTGPTYIGLNSYKNAAILDKISLNVERTVDATRKKLDFGFHVEGIYGADAAFVHSNGIADNQTGRNQWDLLQAYVDVTVPGLPVRIRAGKWLALEGFEQFSANIYGAFGDPARALYSYSYQYLYAEPATQTGVLVTTVLSPQWSFDVGFTRGWNQSIQDANGVLDFLGRVTFTPSGKTSIGLVITAGPEYPTGFGDNLPEGDKHHWWTAFDLVATQKITDKLSVGLGIDYVYASQIPGLTGSGKQWGGIAGYVSYTIDPRFTLNTRLEWYNDSAHGFSNGAPVSASYYEITAGVAIKPFPDHKILSKWLFRPEIRYDHASQPVFNNGDRNNWTCSVDALFTF
ncbi:MAG TPA: outer membrane beta-barrel protein [Thermodesulfobacteriota bacterium]|nr:outer membrane beta-barrel protein [Thermodesulfobacteriota bacterium]